LVEAIDIFRDAGDAVLRAAEVDAAALREASFSVEGEGTARWRKR
jgi:hypothetical protein